MIWKTVWTGSLQRPITLNIPSTDSSQLHITLQTICYPPHHNLNTSNNSSHSLTPQLYGPMRVLASFFMDSHSSLLTALCCHLLTFVSHRFFSTSSNHTGNTFFICNCVPLRKTLLQDIWRRSSPLMQTAPHNECSIHTN